MGFSCVFMSVMRYAVGHMLPCRTCVVTPKQAPSATEDCLFNQLRESPHPWSPSMGGRLLLHVFLC